MMSISVDYVNILLDSKVNIIIMKTKCFTNEAYYDVINRHLLLP